MELATDCRITAEFENRLREGADAGVLGESTAVAWNSIVETLNPVLGVRGVESLSRRCVFVAAVQRAWLRELHDPSAAGIPRLSLVDAFTRQPPAEAAAGGALLIKTLNELLTSLVGASLTERLLQPVWNDFLRGTETQGETP